MSKRFKYILIFILTIICGMIVFMQYQTQKDKHERLAKIGQITLITAYQYESSGVDYVKYYFITTKGQRIEANRKCGNDCDKYINSFVIYNPKDPSEYDLSNDFANYFPTWRIIFFFFIYLPVMIFVTYGFINFGLKIYLKVKNN